MATKVRKSVPVNEHERELIDRLQQPESLERRALELAGIDLPRQASEAQVLHALLAVGGRTLRERTLEIGYAELAAAQSDEGREFRRELRRSDRVARLSRD